MSNKQIKLRKHRVFSEDFKKARIKEYESGQYTISELSRIFKINDSVLYRWVHKYSSYNKNAAVIVEIKDSATARLKDYESKIAQLERALGQKQIHIDFLEKMIDLAKEHYDIDLKKNLNTPPLSGSVKTEK